MTSGNQTVHPRGLGIRVSVGTATVWMTKRWAESWFRDAHGQLADPTPDGRRREIVNSVLLWNVYLFEWVLSVALAGRRDRFERVHVIMRRSEDPGDTEYTISARMSHRVFERLFEEGVLMRLPAYNPAHEAAWQRLLAFRDGLEHARASRPSSSSRPDLPPPVPSMDELNAMAPGWALAVVVERIKGLHEASGGALPDWLYQAKDAM